MPQYIISFLIVSFQVFIGLPLPRLTYLVNRLSQRITSASNGLLCTCPKHLSRASRIFSAIGATLILFLIHSLSILSLLYVHIFTLAFSSFFAYNIALQK
ncbi:hypothetical protein KSP39_PZI021117 [Platanthera zijinensis]|uniref:Uncharacterized protein n=1 Tax=Platanthera zijinensis TaxID=2320716 RepID=A0AAP0AWP4_9ASPA